MRTDVAELDDGVLNCHFFKVHRSLCTELNELVNRISRIIPEIEAARPGNSGRQVLCSLIRTIEKAKLLLQDCSESSKLYLALPSKKLVSRCDNLRSRLEKCLVNIQNMVPVLLAAQISELIDNLRNASFSLDSSEEEAGKVVEKLLKHDASASDSWETKELRALQFAAPRLHITTQKALLIERRSIRKLLDNGNNDPKKRDILKYLSYLLKKYGDSILGEEKENASAQHEMNSASDCSSRVITPEEFKCPLSSRLMYDPVIIASEQTYERMWIQKWFGEGHDTCPKTRMKLDHLNLTPNNALKDRIFKWCVKHGIKPTDPTVQPATLHSLEDSYASIATFDSSTNDLHIQVDLSSISLGSLDNSDVSNSLDTKNPNSLSQRSVDDNEFNQIDLSGLSKHPWESQCMMIKDVKDQLKDNDQSFSYLSSEKFIEPLLGYMRGAQDRCDVKAQKAGFHLLLTFLRTCSIDIPYLHEEAFNLAASFLRSEVSEEALSMLGLLSGHCYDRYKINVSDVIGSLTKILNSQNRDLQEAAIKVLYNLSTRNDVCPCIVSIECIPKLVSFLDDSSLAGRSVKILKNLCDSGEGRAYFAENRSYIDSIVNLLDDGNHENQEHGLAILLSLCAQSVHCCELVMEASVMPVLFSISVNGNVKGKAYALEMLRLLRDVYADDEQEYCICDIDTSNDPGRENVEKRSSLKAAFMQKTKSILPVAKFLTQKSKN